MIRRYRALGIAKKILVILLMLSIIPILSILYFSYIMNTSAIRDQTKELLLANLELTATGVDDFLDTFDRIIMDIYTDSTYAESLEHVNVWDGAYYEAKYELTARMQSIAYVNPDLLGIAIVSLKGEPIFYDSVTLSGVVSYCFGTERMSQDPLIRDSLEQRRTIYSKTIQRRHPEYGERNYFYIAHHLTDFNNYMRGPVGSIVFCIDEAALGDVYLQGDLPESNITFITNRQGDIISFPDKRYIGYKAFDNGAPGEADMIAETGEFLKGTSYFSPRNMEINVRSIRDGEFYIFNAQDLDYALQGANYTTAIIMLIGLEAGIVCVIVALTFAGTTDRSVKKLINAMNRMTKGDYEAEIDVEGADEFAQISRHFDEMRGKVLASTAQERDALLRQKQAEIKSLEAQINPHFLYNTLDAINWVAIEREEFKISKMLGSLAMIMRYSIHGSNEIVTIGQELEHLRRYIYLQQQRFNHSFQCMLEVEPGVLGCRFHKLLVQPLIENAIVHGFPGNTGADEIKISIQRMDEEYIRIVVSDNGRGVEPELVEFFNSFDYRQESTETSIGVRNVIARVQLYYGDRGGFHMQSGDGGTTATVWLPFE